jgi:signal transduction histidine kinase
VPALIRWFRSLDPVRIDWLVAAAAFAASQFAIWGGAGHDDRVVAAVAAIVPSVAVAVRRRWLPEVGVIGLVTVAIKLAVWGTAAAGETGGVGFLIVLLIFYAAGAFYSGRRALLAFALPLIAAAVANVGTTGPALLNLIFVVGVAVLPAWLCGRMARDHAARELAGRERAERLDSERELRVREAALAERARLAREIHDVIAHSVSVMVIQAAGARTVMDREPDRAEQSLQAVERSGREALAELRRLLGALGDGQHLRALAPQPGLEDLAHLVSRAREAGIPSSIRIEGEPSVVSAGVSLCAYRVVQEALTNAIKHAGPAQAQVAVRWRQNSLELFVSDDGRGAVDGNARPAGGGHGIAGMRERVALHGGTVDAGPTPGGGFAVRASIPLAWDGVA